MIIRWSVSLFQATSFCSGPELEIEKCAGRGVSVDGGLETSEKLQVCFYDPVLRFP